LGVDNGRERPIEKVELNILETHADVRRVLDAEVAAFRYRPFRGQSD
jgi:hypothetical protein